MENKIILKENFYKCKPVSREQEEVEWMLGNNQDWLQGVHF